MLPFDPRTLNWAFAAAGTLVVIGIVFAGASLGGPGIAGALGFVLTLLAWRQEEILPRAPLLAFGLAGALTGWLAFLVSGNVPASALLLGVIAYLAALATFGSAGGKARWSLLALWALIASILANTERAPMVAVGFAVGFVLASALLIWGRDERVRSRDPMTLDVRTAVFGEPGRFALAKSVAVALSVPLGFAIFPDAPYWIALTVIIVAQAGRDDTTRLAAQRAAGTLLGVLVGLAIVWLLPGDGLWLTVAFVSVIFCQMLFLNVNYLLYALFLTALIVVGSALVDADVVDVGWQRLLATLVGAAAAVTVVLAVRATSTGSEAN
ncbi:MAG: FUSC family protein [Acidimicrobiia bacterium]